MNGNVASGSASIRRVLFLLPTIEVGGMESFCADQAQELVRRGHEVSVVLPLGKKFDVLVRRFEAGGTTVHRLHVYPERDEPDRFPGLLYAVDILTKLPPLFRSWKPDVVHLHRSSLVGGLPSLLLARLFTNAVVVYTDHDVPFPDLRARYRWTTKAMDRVAHGILAVSRRNAGLRLARLGAIRQKFASILNGIPIIDAPESERLTNRARVRGQLGIADDHLVIGCVVRLVEGKGLETLLEAFGRVRAQHPATLLLVGDGRLRPELERRALAQGLTDSVQFAGFQADPLPYFDAMDVFALAVPAGSMSIALLEAMGRGLPPVITFCGPEEAVIHEETGLCAPPDDPVGLGDALERLASDVPLREHLGRAAAAHVRKHFSMVRVMNDHLEVYATVRKGTVPARLRGDGPPNPRPGGGCPSGGCP
jgi:glycosyltransferase involved in cell wall biosynthesis